VLREEATERAGTSPLNSEKRNGHFACAGCDLPLFLSSAKYESGTGWPSFYAAIAGRVETRTDLKLILPRTEYHCARCGGHQGHVFDDGPKPTGLRYCNNGVALKFVRVSCSRTGWKHPGQDGNTKNNEEKRGPEVGDEK
jgi:peptide-methionine (R)-S-oxide reductase